MAVPALRPPGLIVDPTWAASASHPCHALAGTIKAAIVLASDGTVYDAAGLNTLSGVLVDTNGFVVTVGNMAATNALKSVLTDYTLLVTGFITGMNTGAQFHQNGYKLLVYHYGTGSDYLNQYGGIGGPIYSGSNATVAMGKAHGGQTTTNLIGSTSEADAASQALKTYAAVYRSDGTYSSKTDLIPGGTIQSALPSYASDGGVYVSSTYDVPGSAISGITSAVYASTVEWQLGCVPDSTGTPAKEARVQLGVVFSAPATEAMLDYLIAHPGEMLIAGASVAAAPAAPVAGPMETFPFPIDGYPLRNTSGVVVTDAALTIVGVMDCVADAPVKDGAGVAISLTDTTAISVEYALFGGANLGGCCAMYDIQRYGDAHLCIQAVKAGNTFLPLFIPLRATVSNNDLINLGQVAIDALNSGSAVLTASVGAQTAASRVSSAFVTSGAAVVLGMDTVSNITNAIPTSAAIQAADTAALGASGLAAGSVAAMVAKLSQIDDAEWGNISKNVDGTYSVAEVNAGGVVRGVVSQTYDSAGKLVTKNTTGLV